MPVSKTTETKEALTESARALAEYFKDKHALDFSHTDMLEAIAASRGLRSRNAMLSTVDKSKRSSRRAGRTAKIRLNLAQKAALASYPNLDLVAVEIQDGMDSAEFDRQMEACGDGLFQFIMAELAPDGDTPPVEYLHRMDRAIEEIRAVREAIATKAGLPAYQDLDDREAAHAEDTADDKFGPEFSVRFGRRVIKVPSHPDGCSYIRILDQGREVAYWDAEEWAEDPEGVMGAIMGALRSSALDS